MKLAKGLRIIWEILLHLLAIGVIVGVFWELGKWYFDTKPLWGVDFYYTVTMVKALSENLVFPVIGWFESWFSGWPLFPSYPPLHFYAVVPLTLFVDPISAVKLWMLICLVLYFFGCYAAFFAVSKNRVLSVVLSIATMYSIGVYGALMWGGSLPSAGTQLFFPWVLFAAIRFLQTKHRRYLLGSALLTGISIWGHPQIAIAYIYPGVTLLFFTFIAKPWGLISKEKIKAWFIYLLVSLAIGLPVLSQSAGALKSLFVTDAHKVAASTASGLKSNEAEAIEQFNRMQPERMISDTNVTIFIFIGMSLLVYIIALSLIRRWNMILSVIPFALFALYFTIYVWIFGYGISIYHGGWYRLFWATPLWFGLFASALWGTSQEALQEKREGLLKYFRYSIPVLSLIIAVVGVASFIFLSRSTKEKIALRSNTSSAFPDVLNLRTAAKEQENLRSELVPSWLNGEERNYRLYSGDQTISIWWNALFHMPLFRGYFDPPIANEYRGYFFWVDAALSQDAVTKTHQLVGVFNYPPEIALNNTLFLVDWYAIKYYEAGHAGPTAFAPLPEVFNTPEYIADSTVLDFNKEKYNPGNQTLNYYLLKDEYVSPILMGTNAQTICIIGGDHGYETVVRGLADAALGLKKIIPIKLGKDLDKISQADQEACDSLFVYDYTYSNKFKAFNTLKKYLDTGKNIFIDTGIEVKESAISEILPEIFPVGKTERKPLGSEWELEAGDEEIIRGIDLSSFSPPMFDDAQWNFSYPITGNDLRADSRVILKNYGHPILIEYPVGKGMVYWSGMNLPYHVTRFHNPVEVELLKRILNKMLPDEKEIASYGTATFVSPQKRQITVENARGVLFKEQGYQGWSASAVTKAFNQSLPIYKSGPAYPGFMYVRLPKDTSGTVEVQFRYTGAIKTWMYTFFSFVLFMFVFEEIVLGGRILGKITRQIIKQYRKRIKSWWAKDDIDV